MPSMEMVIKLDEAGAVSVAGPIENSLLAYGMLEVAKDAIRRHHESKSSRIVAPTDGDVLAIRGMQ